MAKILITAEIVVHIEDATVERIADIAEVPIIAEAEEIIIKTLPRYQQPQNFDNNFSNTQSDMPYNETQNQKVPIQNAGQQISNFQPHASFEVFTPDTNYMPYTQQSSITCHKCGYPNLLAPNCTLRGPAPRRGTQNPFNQTPKN